MAFNDVDFCLRVRALGYRVLFTPYAELYHYESKSRGDVYKRQGVERAQPAADECRHGGGVFHAF